MKPCKNDLISRSQLLEKLRYLYYFQKDPHIFDDIVSAVKDAPAVGVTPEELRDVRKAVDDLPWYRYDPKSMTMKPGAHDESDAWYKATDIFNAIGGDDNEL